MKNSIWLGFGLGILALCIGCGGAETKTGDGGDAPSTETIEVAVLCGACGHEKGTEDCCAEDGTKCESCGLHKGSELCCKELADADKGKNLCAACGHVAEEGHECETDCEVCEKCGLHKGAPLCCKLDADDDEAEGDEAEDDGDSEG